MSFQERFDDAVKHSLKVGRNSQGEKKIVAAKKVDLLIDFLNTIIYGTRNGGFFEVFSTSVLSAPNARPNDLLR
jgi:hypothetical protein